MVQPTIESISVHGKTCTLVRFDVIDSTNRVLMDLAREGCENGTIVLARTQDKGRGRLGRSFSSPEGGVYISFLLPVPKAESIGFQLTAMACIAVKRTIKQVFNVDCGIKWVNDLFVNDRKVCGILAQGVDGRVVLGIGVNLAIDCEELPPDVREVAGSLFKPGDALNPDIEEFVKVLIENIVHLCWVGGDKSWLQEYKCSSIILGSEVRMLQAGQVTGTGVAVSIDDDCFLHVMCDDGTEKVLSTGEVSVRKGI